MQSLESNMVTGFGVPGQLEVAGGKAEISS